MEEILILGLPEESSETPEFTDQDSVKLENENDFCTKCRGCFAQEDEMSYLFTSFADELTLAHVIKQCTGYSCEEGDGFPAYLCRNCTTVLVDFFNFKSQFQRTTWHVESLMGKPLINLATDIDSNKDLDLNEEENPDLNEDNDPKDTEKVDKFMPDLSEIRIDSQCKFCQLKFPTKEECETHLAKIHKINVFSKYAKFRQQVEAHRKSTTNDRIKIEEAVKWCRICKKKFPEDEFKIHWDDHKVHVCEQCGYKFIKKSDLGFHKESTHNDAKNYICHICDKSFKIKPLLKRHINIHLNARLFCCEMCGERFNESGTLKTHIRLKHLGTKDFICPICGLAFNMKLTLEKHIMRHNENRIPLFHCEICKNAFQDKSSLKRHHLIKHTKDFVRPSCEFCGKTYSSGTKLRLHIERHHSPCEVERKKRGRKKVTIESDKISEEQTETF